MPINQMAPYIIAEIGSVHDGSFGNAQKLIEAAAQCGANAVKFQTHIPEAETLPDAPSPSYFSAEPRFEYFRRTGFTEKQWGRLAELTRACGVDFLSSPFSIEAVELLEQLGMVAYKIPSGEVTNLPLLERIALTKKPVYLSSGMSCWAELDVAVKVLSSGGPLTVLQCSSVYPCPPEKVGLNVLSEMRDRYRLPVGFSDHTEGFAAAISAVVRGATVVEKHFTFSKLMYGSDARHSMEPGDFKRFCAEVRDAARMVVSPIDKNDLTPYGEMKRIFEKSVVTARALRVGTVISLEDLAFKKPGDGIPAARYKILLGRRVLKDLPANCKISEVDLE
jgi:N,N'-diacetyllegionaminate synthase